MHAHQDGIRATLTQLDKCTWQINANTNIPLILQYQVYAFDNSVRTAWLDSQRGFFNGTSLLLRVHGLEKESHQLTLSNVGLPKNWQAATALSSLKTNKLGFGDYLAQDYDELVDSPVELGPFWSHAFTAAGVPHRLIVSGAPQSFDGEQLLADVKTICETEISFWHGQNESMHHPPHDHYLFMLNAVQDGYGGLEHRHSTALICKRADLPRLEQNRNETLSEGYTTLLGLISHEYFHTWNVKRLRPAEFANYDYSQENYTELLWFFEGFTSYFDDLLLCRAGLINNTDYLTILNKTINQVLQTPGRYVQSVAQASFDAWVKYYRQDENTLNTTVSYYSKGALVALCLDLSLRTSGTTSLDAVMRSLWQRCAGGPMNERDLLGVIADLSSPTIAEQLVQWVHGTDELPLKSCLEHHGVNYETTNATQLDRLGLKVKEHNGLFIKSVLRDSLAEQAGFAAGDEWLGIELGKGKTIQRWRLNHLADLNLYLGSASACQVLIARDQRLLTLTLNMPNTVHSVKLSISNPEQLNAWLMNPSFNS